MAKDIDREFIVKVKGSITRELNKFRGIVVKKESLDEVENFVKESLKPWRQS